MDFYTVFAAVLAANLATVWAVWCFYQISRKNTEAASAAYWGAASILLFAALGVYVAAT